MSPAIELLKNIKDSIKDLLPIIVVISFFQVVVLQQPVPGIGDILVGVVFVILGLTFFVRGLEMALFPLGESLAQAFARKGSALWLFTFSFFLGFGTTIAEPALIAIADEAAKVVAAAGKIENHQDAMDAYAFNLRITVAMAVGIAILLGVLRIVKGWPIQYLIMGGYAMVVILTLFAPAEIIGIAYDSGGVTTSTITVPLVTALGVGLASSITGRNPLTDGFGLIAFASLTPIMFVMVFGMVTL